MNIRHAIYTTTTQLLNTIVVNHRICCDIPLKKTLIKNVYMNQQN